MGSWVRWCAAFIAVIVSGLTQAQSIVQPGFSSNGRLDVMVPADGLPFVAFQDASTVKALKCGTPTCSSGNTVTTIANMTVRRLRVAVGGDGFPVIGISIFSSSGLRMAYCKDPACSIVALSNVDTASLGANTDHALVVPPDGRPVFAYYDSNNQDLKVARCDDESCSSSQVSVVDAVGSVGFAPAIALIAGLPQIAYNANSVALKLVRCGTLACDSANVFQTLANENATDTSMLAGRDGAALIAYKHDVATQDALRLIKCSNAFCSTQTASLLDSTNVGNGLGGGVTMRDGADGLPVIAYIDSSFASIKLLRCTRPDCATTSITTAHAPATGVLTVFTPAALAISAAGTPVLGYGVGGSNGMTLNFCNTRSCQ
jgi:hypothetical protein